MATPFLKVDLSSSARDFEQAALEPGIPLLDKTGAHYRTLRKWLGRLIAEPEWRGAEISFYLCDDSGNRPHDVRCEAASASDRSGVKSLKEDMEAIKRKLQEAKPDVKEAKLHQAMLQHFTAAANPAGPKQSEYHFFRYQTGGQWRLAWCWGYQRKDVVPAAATICTNPNCRQLFLRRQEGSRDCPACASSAVAPPRRKSRAGLFAGALVLILLATGLGYVARGWFFPTPSPGPAPGETGLVAMPTEWAGPAGSELAFKVVRHKADGEEEDVTNQVVPVSENPRVARVERGGARVKARSTGKTAVVFYLGDEQTQATLEVKPPQNPTSIKFEPAEVELGVGTTARLRVQGELDGKWHDLTESVEWQPVSAGKVSCQAGQLQGLAEGETVVKARYRATPKDPYRLAEAKIKVVQEKYAKLELSVSPAAFKEGTDAGLTATLHTADGKQRSALNSSLLSLHVDSSHVATVAGEYLHGRRAGRGKLAGKFSELTASTDFAVEADLSGRFVVTPKELQMVVGELAELQVASASSEPVRIVSSAPDVVAVTSDLKLVGRKPGKATLRIVQEAFEKEIQAEVTPAEFKSIAFAPPRTSVPVDGTIPVRLVGTLKDEQQVDLAPEAVAWESVPQASVVELDVEKLQLLGRTPTDDSPQDMMARVGNLRASGQVDVVPSPLLVELTPAGETTVPEGQTTQLHAFAQYGSGNRTEIEPDRIEWRLSPPSDSGLVFDPQTAAVQAKKTNATLKVKAIYQGYTSNEIELRSITQDLELALHADRAIILAGDRGQFEASVRGAPLEFSLEGAQFESSDPELLVVDKESGGYRALKPGKVTASAQHANAKQPAILELEIVAPGDAELVIRPAKFQLLVNGRQPIDAALVAGMKEDPVSLTDGDYAPPLAIAQPELVKWQAPVLSGIKPGGPFEVTLAYAGKTARATVEVIKGDGKIRVVPPQARLSPGQALSPRLEQNVSGDLWQEIEPTVVEWKVPKGLNWTAARGDLRPQLTPSESASGTLALEASYAGKTATLQVEVATEPPPKGPLAVVREPGGEDLPVGAEQRYTIVVGPEGQQVPAANVEWQPAFENDYVRWNPPVLYAKRAGHEQVLTAAVGGEDIAFATRTVEAAQVERELAIPSDKPTEVRIVAGQPQPIVLPVGTRFSSFRVEALFAGEEQPVNVTPEALLQTAPADNSPIAASGGQIICQGLGDAELSATFRGVSSKTPLKIKVVEDVKVALLSVDPSSVRLAVGERVTLKVIGHAGKSEEPLDLGDITALPKLAFSSDHPEIVAADGPTLSGEKPGNAKITVTADGVSATVDVEVLPSGSTREPLTVSPRVLKLRVGESKWLGKDVTVQRGNADVTDQIGTASPSSDVVIFHPESQSLEGVIPGRALVALDVDGQLVSLPVEVEQGTAIEGGKIVIEPATGKLAVGEVLQLKVWLAGEGGELVDRTASAVLVSSDPEVLSLDGAKVLGMAPGEATISASLSGIAEAANAKFKVATEKFASIDVTPTTLRLSVGERKALKVEGVGPAGRRTLGAHPDLSLKVSGDAGAVELAGLEIRGVKAGKATVQAEWPGAKSKPVNIVVTDDPITGLRIEPTSSRIGVGEGQALQVFARRGDKEQLVTSNDGLELKIADRRIVALEGDQSIRGLTPGTTKANASLGSHRASADIRVLRGGGGLVGPGSSLSGGRGRGNGATPRGRGPRGGNSGVGAMPGPGKGKSPSGGSSGSGSSSPGTGNPGGNDPAQDLSPGLRFIPDVLQMQLGVPGAPVRLVYISPRGTVEDVISQAKLEIQPEAGKDVISIQSTALGPIFVGKKVGEANVVGSHAGHVTREPLRVIVVDPDSTTPGAARARMIVAPDPYRLAIGKKGRFRRVQLVPPGGKPVDIEFKLESQDESVVTIDGLSMVGMKPGTAIVTVRPVDIPASLGDVKTDVTVRVLSPPSLSAEGTRLVLSGPDRLTAGVPGSFQVELEGDGNAQEVTNEGAILVVDADQASTATVQPGCVLIAKQPGQLAVRARYKDLVSGVKLVQVDPATRDFKELRLEADPAPLAIGERRPYKVWGVPKDGSLPQDLTHQVGGDLVVRALPTSGSGADCFAHEAPEFIGKKSGGFAARASLGELNSNVLKLTITDAPLAKVGLAVVPGAVTIAVGERTPPLRVVAKAPGDPEGRTLDATWSSASPDIAAPVAGAAGVFEGKRAGRTSLEATYNGQTVSVDVTVTGNAFENVSLKRGSLEFLAGNRFSVTAIVQANSEAALEYRLVTAGGSEAGDWQAVPAGPQKFELVTPQIRQGERNTRYHLLIEARDAQQRVVNRYPFSFKLVTDVTGEP